MRVRPSRPPRWFGFIAALLSLCSTASAQTPSETTEYYGLDAVGSVRIVFDPAGNVLARLDYAPFGRELSSAANAPDRKFAALFRDGEAGLDYAEARSYQVRTGRFNTMDPVYDAMQEPQLWNRYAYASNNPLKFVDPDGEFQISVSCGAGPQWCPGSIQAGPDNWIDIDGQFNPQYYGYQGGNPDKALNEWGNALDLQFLAGAIYGPAEKESQRGKAGETKKGETRGECKKARCGQITNDYADGGKYKDENKDYSWHDFNKGDVAVNTDGAKFGNDLFKVATYVHITIGADRKWRFDSRLDWVYSNMAAQVSRNERTGWYDYSKFVKAHPDWALSPPKK